MRNLGREAEPIVRLAEALVVAFSEQHRHCARMAISRKEIAKRIETEAERIYLSPAVLLDRGAIRTKAVSVARGHVQHVGAFAAHFHMAVVAESMVGIDPAVDPTCECVLVAVRVDNSKRAKLDLLLVGDPVAIRIREPPDIWNRPGDCFRIAKGYDT